MKLDFYSDQEKLLHELSLKGIEAKEVKSVKEVSSSTLLIGQEKLTYSDLQVAMGQGYKNILYVLTENQTHDIERGIKAVCDSLGVIMIPSQITESQKVDRITEVINPTKGNKASNVFTFLSVLPNIGTTSTVLSIAKALNAHTDARVGVLGLNLWDDGTDQLDYKGMSLDQIKGKLQNNLFSVSDEKSSYEFLSSFHMEEKERLYILGGNRNTKMQRLFTTDEVSTLINLSKKVFDVVLIDAGSQFDNAGMVQSLAESDMKFLVLNQQRKAIKKYQEVHDHILYPLGYKPSDFLMIVNQYKEHVLLSSPKDINKEIDVPLLTTIEYMKEASASEVSQKVLYDYDEPAYNESINALLRSITSHLQISLKEDSGKRKGWLRRLTG